MLLLSFLTTAHAGRSCESHSITASAMQKAVNLAMPLYHELQRLQPEVAILARVGSDISKYNLRYTHAAFVWRDHPKGSWIVVHSLNHCGSKHSGLFDEGLINFFVDQPFEYRVRLIIPKPDLQQAIAKQLINGQAQRLHSSRYSMLAYPFSQRYQNSNQWLLEVIAAGLSDQQKVTRTQAQQLLYRRHYQPDQIALGFMEQVGADLFSAHIAFDDHPKNAQRYGRYSVVTVRSIERFLNAQNSVLLSRELAL